MVSQADRELIQNFVAELRPYLDTVNAGVHEFAQPNRDGVVVGQAVQALVMIRGAGQILMVDGLVSIASWLTESFEAIQNNPDIPPVEASRRLGGLSSAMEDFLYTLDRGDDVDSIVLRARTIFEAIPLFSGPLPGTGKLRRHTDLDALFGDDERTAPTDRIISPDAIDTEKLGAKVRDQVLPFGPLAETPEAGPTVPLQQHSAATRPIDGEPARIVPLPPQPTEKLPTVDPELREIFEEEALDIIGAFGDNIRILAGSPDDLEALDRLNRAAHTLKGAANMTGFPVVGQIGAAIELLMDEHLERHKPVSRDALELVAVSWKMLRAMMPHLNDLSGFTSPSNSVVQRANVLREQLALDDAEAETISIDRDQYGQREAITSTPLETPTDKIITIDALPEDVPEAPEFAPEAMDTVATDAPLDDLDAGALVDPATEDVVIEDLDDVPPVHEARDEVIATEAASYSQAPEAVDELVDDSHWDEPTAETSEAFDDSDEKPQSEPFWSPGTEELMRSAVGTDMLIAELQDIPDFVEDLDTEIDAQDQDPFFSAVEPDATHDGDDAAHDDGEWLTGPGRPGTDLLNFEARPQTEPFWSSLEDRQPDADEAFALDEPVTMDPFFAPVIGASPFAQSDGFDTPGDVDGDLSEYRHFLTPTETSDTEPDEPVSDDFPASADVETEEALDEIGLADATLDAASPDDHFVVEEILNDDIEEPAHSEAEHSGYVAGSETADEFTGEETAESECADELPSDMQITATFQLYEETDSSESVESTDSEPATAPESDDVYAFDFDVYSDPFEFVQPLDLIEAQDSAAPASATDTPEAAAEQEPSEQAATFDSEDGLHGEDLATATILSDDPGPSVIPAMLGDMSEIIAAATLGVFEALAQRQANLLAEEREAVEVSKDFVLDDLSHEGETDDELDVPLEVETEAEAEPFGAGVDVEAVAHDEPEFNELTEDAAMDADVDGEIAISTDNLLLDELGLRPFDVSDTVERDSSDFVMQFPDIDDDELDRLVAEIEGGSLASPDWLAQGSDDSDITGALESELEAAQAVHAPDPISEAAPEAQPASEAIEASTRTDSDVLTPPAETGRLGSPSADTLGPGTISLDRFLTSEGSAALSSALLDMAFSTPAAGLSASDFVEPASISVFDESSERALEIEMFETFALEASDHLEILNRAAMHLDRDPHTGGALIEIKRALHTLKGAAAAAELDDIGERAHALEDSLASQERQGVPLNRDFTTDLFLAIEEIEDQIARRKDELFGTTDEEQQNPTLRVDVARVDGLLNTVGELVVNRSGFEERLERLGITLDDLSTAAERLQRSNYLLEREAHAEDAIGRLLRGEFSGPGDSILINATHTEWDTLEMDRYTEFDRLIRQLAEVGADVSAAVGEIAALRGDLDTISTRQRRLTTALQDELMGVRMVPISTLAPRLYRVVRRAAQRRGKEVSLVLEGGETPFDKLLLDTLSESLLHLLRNSVDHGIEDGQTRRRLGKPETGTIRIRAYRDGSEAVIEIIDDGAGIDQEAVARQALERGIITDGDLTREEMLSLIFEPGFTTREEADDISGRGLGLEIVEQTVARYKGRVAVDSVPGHGTIFSLRLPVMLSVIQAFLVTAGEGEFAIPVANVDYVVDRVDQPLTQIGESIVVESGGQIIPVVDVGGRLGQATVPIMEREDGWVMISEVGGKRWALVVDDLHSQQEIVVKPMGRFLRSMPGLMGATILGHGDVALIVDVPTLLGIDVLGTRLAPADMVARKAGTSPVRSQTEILLADQAKTILIVDDSLSVRRVVSRTVERHGWIAILARDGAEALEILDQRRVDIVITDIEMPRMDGFELISSIRSRNVYNDLPIVVLTSRSGEKHRERAFSLGADEYLVKPFQEQELVGIVEDVSRLPSRAR